MYQVALRCTTSLLKHISCDCRYNSDGKKFNLSEVWRKDKCRWESEKRLKENCKIDSKIDGILVYLLDCYKRVKF